MGQEISRSRGGIVFGGDVQPGGSSAVSDLGRNLRRRWASGIAVVLTEAGDDGYRGFTATSVMVVSDAPLTIALSVSAEGEFGALLGEGARLAVSILEARHEFLAERFAGRAPLPDRALTGVGHRLEGDLPVIAGALAWCIGTVSSIQLVGDHHLVLITVNEGGPGEDTDDPLLRYEGRYRRLEAG